jgi:hypothetical protein
MQNCSFRRVVIAKNHLAKILHFAVSSKELILRRYFLDNILFCYMIHHLSVKKEA